jgi:hypothetical protein
VSCNHQPHSINGVVLQAQSGNWHAAFLDGGRRVLYRVTHCPWCGVELWGRRQEPAEEMPGMAHARGAAWSQ